MGLTPADIEALDRLFATLATRHVSISVSDAYGIQVSMKATDGAGYSVEHAPTVSEALALIVRRRAGTPAPKPRNLFE